MGIGDHNCRVWSFQSRPPILVDGLSTLTVHGMNVWQSGQLNISWPADEADQQLKFKVRFYLQYKSYSSFLFFKDTFDIQLLHKSPQVRLCLASFSRECFFLKKCYGVLIFLYWKEMWNKPSLLWITFHLMRWNVPSGATFSLKIHFLGRYQTCPKLCLVEFLLFFFLFFRSPA